MREYEIFNLMQIAGGTFPSGGFSQSWGLETYVSLGQIKDEESFKTFLLVYLESNIGKCEGPIALEAYKLAEKKDVEGLIELNHLSTAIKTTKESREGTIRMGKAFLRIMREVLDKDFMAKISPTEEINYPVAYGIVCQLLNTKKEEAIKAFVFSTVNGIIQSGVKLIPLGNTQAQKIIYNMREEMEKIVELAFATKIEDISNFCPGLDIASIKHETLDVRLYMS